MRCGWLPVIRDDGVVVGSLEVGLSQHQPCMPRVKKMRPVSLAVLTEVTRLLNLAVFTGVVCILLGTNG